MDSSSTCSGRVKNGWLSALLLCSCVARATGDGGPAADTFGPIPELPPVELPAAAVRVSAGEEFSCAVLVDGRVSCWGLNDVGQLGLGHTETIGDDESPIGDALEFPHPAVDVELGEGHACALLENGDVHCWGRSVDFSGYGELREHDPQRRADESPPLPFGFRIIAFDVSGPSTCVHREDARLVCGTADPETGVREARSDVETWALGETVYYWANTAGFDDYGGMPQAFEWVAVEEPIAHRCIGADFTCGIIEGGTEAFCTGPGFATYGRDIAWSENLREMAPETLECGPVSACVLTKTGRLHCARGDRVLLGKHRRLR